MSRESHIILVNRDCSATAVFQQCQEKGMGIQLPNVKAFGFPRGIGGGIRVSPLTSPILCETWSLQSFVGLC